MISPLVCGYISLADTRIYYEVYGQGSPVMLLHGNGEDLHVFDTLIPALAAQYRVIALDTRGHGKSGRGTQPLDFITLARDVAGVMEQLQVERAPIVGYSDGGNTALHLALYAPKQVAGLALLGANLHPRGIVRRWQIPIQLGYAACSAIARFYRPASPKRDILGLMVNHPRLTPEQIAAINAPALVIAGERDMVNRAHTEAIAGAIAGARLHILAGEDHFGIARSPRALALILDWLENC